MPLIEIGAAAGGGCVAGAVAALGLLGKKNAAAPSQAAAPQPQGFMRSPGRLMMSPVTHLRRDEAPNSSSQRVSSDASLTNQLANMNLAQGCSRFLDKPGFVSLMRKLIGETKYLQNNPKMGVNPQEKRAAAIVMQELQPYAREAGGPLVIEELEYVPGRSNLKITYPGTTRETVAFIGSHFDVVPADPETWDKDPFSLTEEGDKLYGRGTTDCLGHVALLTCLLKELGKSTPKLKRTIVVLFIAGEEGGEMGVGVDVVVEKGKLSEIKGGPVFWVDTADSQPCCGSSGMMSWSLKCKGRLFHSGFPHKGINSIELANEVVKEVQCRFYEQFPKLPEEEAYQFATGSHMKPTQIECVKGSLNQICPECTVSGDIRLSPFYDVEDVVEAIEGYVADINASMQHISGPGDWSKFSLPKNIEVQPNELREGKVELKWNGDLSTFKTYAGIAVKLDSQGHKALVQAMRETYAKVSPFSVSGSLPLVKMMQKQGFDIQLCGFGLMSVYHGINEYVQVSDMEKAYEVMLRLVCLLESVV